MKAHGSDRTIQTADRGRLGLTMIEVLVVIALVAAAAAMALPFGTRSLGGRKVAAGAELVSDALRQAQAAAMSGRDSRRFGVHFESGQFVYFEGAAYNPADPENVVHDLDADLALSHDLSGGVDDVLFSNHRGLPSADGTVTMTADSGQYRIITIGPEGAIGE